MWKKTTEFFISSSHLFLFALKTLWIIAWTDMKKESKEQNEEYERTRNNERNQQK
jgi:hypothetical protein